MPSSSTTSSPSPTASRYPRRHLPIFPCPPKAPHSPVGATIGHKGGPSPLGGTRVRSPPPRAPCFSWCAWC
ncbi:UNVERIFIED_CONTAM: hypothetical protein H355_003788 [Colinus virginianus]|nr:hypothetical protein H355_003788 [Colinus virginianus]